MFAFAPRQLQTVTAIHIGNESSSERPERRLSGLRGLSECLQAEQQSLDVVPTGDFGLHQPPSPEP
jgi:hypothetical protein